MGTPQIQTYQNRAYITLVLSSKYIEFYEVGITG